MFKYFFRNDSVSVTEKREKILEFRVNSRISNSFIEEFLLKNKDFYRFKLRSGGDVFIRRERFI